MTDDPILTEPTPDRPSPHEKPELRIVEDYLSELKAVRSSGAGVPETSYYPALSNLFNAVGKTLKPKVRCIINLQNRGAGLPDGGLFTADQFQRQADTSPKSGQPPARGAIEAKGTKPDIRALALSTQVKNYLQTYRIVIATNLRSFAIVTRSENGAPEPMEIYSLADSEEDFWRQVAAHPRGSAQLKGEPFIEFIKRACLHNAPLTNPKDVAWFLASYARDALFRVEQKKQLPALQSVRSALEEALGMKFTGEKGEHFFRSTLVQTIFYGVFSAWVRWCKDNPAPAAKFDWRSTDWSLHIPFIRTLYEAIATRSKLEPLGLVEVLDWTANVLNRVTREEFFRSFEDEHAVQYFYEPFLEAYDPDLRKALGVWYTPREIVKYQVARVDRVLREELDLPDGLADPNVIVLDPCCGTGAYLVEVLHSIAATLRDKGGDALVASDLKQAAMNRVFGFEIMPAPFVVSHLQLSSLLQNKGAPLSNKKAERVGVYLTNSLTGWEPPKGPKQHIMTWSELEEERDAAEHVKRDKKILVVLGNPPYNGFAGVAVEEERSLSNAYRTTKIAPPPTGQGLNDLYVRFFRMAERRIAEMSGCGIVSLITNYSWLDGLSYTGMRERFLEAFDQIRIDCMNGDKYRTGKLTPEGLPDPSVFSTAANREGIQVGTAVTTLVRAKTHSSSSSILFRSFWGANKRQELLTEAIKYSSIAPNPKLWLSFVPLRIEGDYLAWPTLPELMPTYFPGVKSGRDELVVDIDRERLIARMIKYFDPDVSDAEFSAEFHGSLTSTKTFNASATRAVLQRRGFREDFVIRFAYRAFDSRHIYLERDTNLIERKRGEFISHISPHNLWLKARQKETSDTFSRGFATRLLADNFGNGLSNFFPLKMLGGVSASSETGKPRINSSERAAKYIEQLQATEESAFLHSLAILNTPLFRQDHAEALRQDWPRIPLPTSRDTLERSATLGKPIAALLDTESEVPGVTTGKISPALKTIGLITKTTGGAIDPSGNDLIIEAAWGHFGKDGVVMPARGKLENRQYDPAETAAIDAEAESRAIPASEARRLFGETTLDIYLNGVAFWRNIPLNVWEYRIGGYQVIKKWLSYREYEILGRSLKPEEAREVTNIARRIAAIILLQPKLDENYRKVKEAAFDWPPLAGKKSQ
jgi:Type ISP C-terminal specificity domain/N-6 DNA Methylase